MVARLGTVGAGGPRYRGVHPFVTSEHSLNTAPAAIPGSGDRALSLRWRAANYVLASMTLLSVCVCLWLGHQLVSQAGRAAEQNERWAERLNQMTELARLAVLLHAPASAAITAEDPAGARAALSRGRAQSVAMLGSVRASLNELSESERAQLVDAVSAAAAGLQRVAANTESIVEACEREDREAAVNQLADLDAGLSGASQSIHHLITLARSMRAGWFDEQKSAVQSLQRLEFALSALVLLTALAAIAHTGRMHRRIQVSGEALAQHTAALEAANADLARATRAAEEANRTKSAFLANMSHEIRTPMTAILGFADVLLAPESNEEERIDAARTLHRNGQHLLTLVNDILDLSKIEAGRMEVELAPTPLRPIVRDVLDLCSVKAAEKGLLLDVALEGAVPDTVVTDSVRLKQALVNLMMNAIKFTSRGGVCLDIGCDPEARQLRFHVTDSGIGLTKEQIARLFRPFTQADVSTTRLYGGTGLGLTITKWIALQLGGDVTLVSAPGKGSTFTLTIGTGALEGVEMVKELTRHARRETSMTTGAALPSLRGRVLLAEDGPDNQRLVSHLLRKAGATVEVVGHGKLALDAALEARERGEPFDLILMDMQMPFMDGYTATRALRDAGYTGPVIAFTAHAMKGEQDKCFAVGCDAYLSKPISREKLITEVAHYMPRAHEPGARRAA